MKSHELKVEEEKNTFSSISLLNHSDGQHFFSAPHIETKQSSKTEKKDVSLSCHISFCFKP